MSNERDPKEIENEQQEETKAIDELTSEELDQVAGGGIEPSPWRAPSQVDHSLPDQMKRPASER
jgi:hypothetical protein